MKEELLVSSTIVISVTSISRWVVSWWGAIIRWSSMSIDVGVYGWVIATIWVIEATTAMRVIINRGAGSWRRTAITSTVIIIVATARWASVTITVTTRAVSSGWAAPVVVIRVRSASRGAGSGSVAGNVRLGISDAGDSNALEFAAIKLLYCSFEIRSSFELDEAFAVTVATGFGVDNVEAGLTGEVFEVLYPESM